MADHNKQLTRPAILQMMEVGLYWRQIKGRFSNKTSRTYLAMKYGLRWMNRIKQLKAKKYG